MDALRGLLRPLGWPVHVTLVVTGQSELPSFPYLLLVPPPGNYDRITLDNSRDTINDLFDVITVDMSTASVLLMQAKVRTALIDVAPVVVGYRVDQIRHVDTRPVTPDRDVKLERGFPLYSTQRFRYSANPI